MLSNIERIIQYLHSNHTANSYNVSVSPQQVFSSAFCFWEIQTDTLILFYSVSAEQHDRSYKQLTICCKDGPDLQ